MLIANGVTYLGTRTKLYEAHRDEVGKYEGITLA